MKRLKTYKLFESRNYDISIVNSMLLDYSDKDISVNTYEGSWTIGKDNVEWIKIDIRNFWHGSVSTSRNNKSGFKIEECLFDVIDYLEECGLVLMQESYIWNDTWQHYVGCPECLSEDIEDNYNLTTKTICHRCGYMGSADSFLVDAWPVDRKFLEESIKDGKLTQEIQLTFSDRRNIY